ncbi:S8 family peptidase [Dyadobacter sp. NIV53]|uniref:S8 family peptidase n=1 Tax=Dyadobacter sp. NIV53 TaxID=2861765 RepID=UPI001C873872|nr:S8 family peptidase [Dyadobacter sp. NIV53]
MAKSILLILFCILFTTSYGIAQSNPRYLILYKDKANSLYTVDKPAEFLSERSISRRARQNIPVTIQDFPVNPGYVWAIGQTGAKVIYSSRWFNGSLVEASDAQLADIKKLSFYKGIELNLPVANLTSKSPGIERISAVDRKMETSEELNYGRMNDQLALMEVPQLHDKGFHGENMIISVIDNGFINGKNLGFLKPVFDENRVLDTHDFVGRDGNVYNDGSHGLEVLSTIAAYAPSSMIGAAFKATFALYVTEANLVESPYEEITWLLAAERADSVGTDIISSSLGYSYFDGEFDTPAYNHTYADMDGKTTIISRAARYATRKGILVVISAGNEGNDPWRYITAPADVDSVLSVGATNYDLSYAAFSSIGPNYIGQQKPDVAAVGAGTVVGNASGNVGLNNGTSFSTPLIAGLSAILWQAYPYLSAQQVISVLKRSGNQANNPDNMLGYGVPSVSKAENIIYDEFKPLGVENDLLKSIILSPNPTANDLILTIPQSLVGKKASFRIFHSNGGLLSNYDVNLSQTMAVNTKALTTGLYIAKIKVGNLERALKFIKQ